MNMEEPLISKHQDEQPSSPSTDIDSPANTSFNSKYSAIDYRQFSIDVEKNKATIMATKLEKLKGLKLFPIFDDPELGKLSPTYFLYLEFLHGVNRMLFWILICITVPSALFIYFGLNYNPFFKYHTDIDVRYVYVIAGILGSFLVSYLRKREEDKIFANEGLYERNCSEDLYTVLVKNLPRDVTIEEIKYHFENNFSQGEHIVEDVILLQNYYQYNKIELQIRKVMQRNLTLEKKLEFDDSGKVQQKIDALAQQKAALMEQLLEHRREIVSFNNFEGKALVIFKTQHMQHVVFSAYNRPWYRFSFNSTKEKDPKAFIKVNKIIVQSFGPPEDIKFEYLHYPKVGRILRNIAAYGLGSTVTLFSLWLFIVLMGKMNVWGNIKKLMRGEVINVYFPKEAPKDLTFWEVVHEITQPIYMTIAILCISWVIGTTFGIVKGIKISSNTLKLQISFYRNGLFGAFINFIVIGAFFQGMNGTHNWLKGIRLMIESMFIRKIIFKLIDMCTVNCKPNLFVKITHNLCGISKVFDPFGAVSNLIPVTFIAFTFYALNPFLILGGCIATIYVMAIFDKYRMMKLCDFPTFKSRTVLVRIFTTYKVFPTLFFWGSLNVLRIYDTEYRGGQLNYEDTFFYYLIGAGLLLRLAAHLMFPQTVGSDINMRFLEKHGDTTYEEARQEFISCYRLKYPWAGIEGKDSKDMIDQKLATFQTADVAITDITVAPDAGDAGDGGHSGF